MDHSFSFSSASDNYQNGFGSSEHSNRTPLPGAQDMTFVNTLSPLNGVPPPGAFHQVILVPVGVYADQHIQPRAIKVSNVPDACHPSTAAEWLSKGHYIFDFDTHQPLIMDYLANDGNLVPTSDLNHPTYDFMFDIGRYNDVYKRQIRQIDWCARRRNNATVYQWSGAPADKQIVTLPDEKLDIERRNPLTLTAAELACRKYLNPEAFDMPDEDADTTFASDSHLILPNAATSSTPVRPHSVA